MSSIRLIGVSGAAGAGKDLVGKLIQNALNNEDRPGWKIHRFAGKLKECAAIILGVPVHIFENRQFKESHLEEWEMTVREFLQKLGQSLREAVHKNVWVDVLMRDVDKELSINLPKRSISENWKPPTIVDTTFKSLYKKTEFKCNCGKVFLTTQWQVNGGDTKSCGCYQKLRVSELSKLTENPSPD